MKRSRGFIGKTESNTGVFKIANLKEVFKDYRGYRVVFMKQVHSDNIETVDSSDTYDKTDALITDEKKVILTGTFADCAPIYFYVKNTDIIALAHSGWRGSKLKIATKVIGRIIKDYNVDPKDIYVIIGPCISKESYEVQEDFLANFDSKFFVHSQNKIYFDLKRYNYDIISSVIPEKNITIDSRCTFKDTTLHSYRREKEKSGRNIAFIYND